MDDDTPPTGRPRILICGWAGAGNIGDELLTASIIAMVGAAGGEPVVSSRDPVATVAEHRVPAVPWGLGARPAVGTVDGVIVGPGGILQDRSSLWNIPGHLAAARVATKRGLPVAAIGVGAEPLRRRSSALLLRAALGDAPIVTRDDASSDALRAAGLAPVTGSDLAFSLDLDAPPPATGTGIVVAVGPAVRPGLVRPAAQRLSSPSVDAMVPAIAAAADRVGGIVTLAAFRGGRDRAFAAELAVELPMRHRLLDPTVAAHVDAISSARLVVASRYHAVVLAARFGVPAFVVSDEPKLRSLVAALGPERARAGSWVDLATAAVPEPVAPVSTAELPGADRARSAVGRLVEAAGGRRS